MTEATKNAEGAMAMEAFLPILKDEVKKLYGYLQKIKQDLAAIRHTGTEVDHFEKVADQLKAIVEATEDATQNIMDAAENLGSTVTELSQNIRFPEAKVLFDKAEGEIARIFEACAFQDITGQRISKIVKTMNLIEGTVNSLIVTVGTTNDVTPLPLDPIVRIDQGVRLDGPVRSGEGVSQNDIDKMFD